uniref:sarcosine oxidase subunit gamma n=2 Tax=Agrobacterium cavarae TaxID=2528239 RepID=UPI0028A7D09A|nr:sarcosine oxidase subunit gamma [Agrobacterium cavarae]
MPDQTLNFKSGFQPTLRPVLGAKKAFVSNMITLSALQEGTIIHVLAEPSAPAVEDRLRAVGKGNVRTVSPGQWFIVSDERLSHGELKALLDALEPQAMGVDQSQGRVRIRIEGKMVERVLAKGTAVDLSLPAFPVGSSVTALIGHITAHLTRLEESAFEIIVLRGFAESLWDDLVRMSAEFA